LLIDEEKHPAGVRDPKKEKITPQTAFGVRVREALLRLVGGNIVAKQKLLFIVLIPFELGHLMRASSAWAHTSSFQCAAACTSLTGAKDTVYLWYIRGTSLNRAEESLTGGNRITGPIDTPSREAPSAAIAVVKLRATLTT
jgi:hypothetical protein